MPLDRQTVEVKLGGGLDTKTDPKQVVPGKLLALENSSFESPGRFRKRNGFTSLGTPSASASFLATRGDELLAGDTAALYSYDATGQTWRNRGAFTEAATSVPYSVASAGVQPTVAVIGTYHCLVYYTISGTVYSVIDSTTGHHVVDGASVAGAGNSCAFVLPIGGKFVIFYSNGGGVPIKFRVVDPATPSSIGGAVSVGAASFSPYFDVAQIGSLCYVAYYSAANALNVIAYDSSMSVVNTLIAPIAVPTALGKVAVFGTAPVSPSVALAWIDGTNVRFAAYSADLQSTLKAATTIEAIAISTGAVVGTSDGTTITLVYNTSVAPSVDSLRKCAITIAGYAIGAPAQWFYRLQIVGKPIAWGSLTCLPLSFQSKNDAQTSYFVADIATGRCVSKAFPGQASKRPSGLASSSYWLPSKPVVSGATLLWACETKARALGYNGSYLDYDTKVAMIQMTLAAGAQWQEAAGSTHIAGGLLEQYDGSRVVEHGFNVFPDALTLTGDTPGATYSYQYCACFTWVDANGCAHWSSPSPVATITQGAAIGTASVSIAIATLPLTGKQVEIALFRTTNYGSVFYRVGASTTYANDPLAATVTILDSIVDGSLVNNAQIYTTGGVIENIAAPPCSAMVLYKNRVVLVNSETPTELWYSKQVIPGSPVEFSDALTLNIDPQGGGIVALAPMDDKLIIFKKQRIFWMTGTGPDATGGQNDFSDPAPLPADIGCVNAASVARCPAGLIFQAAKGLYLLDRSLNVSYIGADAESYVGQVSDLGTTGTAITSAQAVPTLHQVRWTQGASSSRVVVYDYRAEQWGAFTGIDALASAIWKGAFAHVTTAGQVFQEQMGSYVDGAAFVAQRWQTGWLKVAGLQGYQRAYKLFLLGDYVSPHNLRVQIAYDYDPSIVQTDTITSPSDPGAPYQWRIDLARQKCEAIQVTVSEVQSGGSTGEGVRLSGLAFEVGVKRGLNKLPASRQLG